MWVGKQTIQKQLKTQVMNQPVIIDVNSNLHVLLIDYRTK